MTGGDPSGASCDETILNMMHRMLLRHSALAHPSDARTYSQSLSVVRRARLMAQQAKATGGDAMRVARDIKSPSWWRRSPLPASTRTLAHRGCMAAVGFETTAVA